MVKRNASHNHIAVMVPLWVRRQMIANWQFEPDAARPGLIRQRQIQRLKATDLQMRLDPFALRNDFWQVKNEGDMLALLNKTGVRWGTDEAFFMSDALKFQEFTRQAVTKPVSSWQNLPAGEVPKGNVRGGAVWYADAIASLSNILCQPVTQGWNKGDLALTVGLQGFKQAILASVVIDKLQQNRYHLCRKPGCGMPFKVDIRKKKQYCSELHRQSEAMRRSRKRRKGNKR